MEKRNIIILLSFFIISNIKASHILGSRMGYEHQGNQKYKITLQVYSDCSWSVPTANPLRISCGSTIHASASLTNTFVKDVTDVSLGCGSSKCAGGSYAIGISEHTYEATIDLSIVSCCQVTISWQEAGRSNLISTGAVGTNYYTETTLNKCVGNSFQWAQFSPQFLLFVGEDQILNFSGYDSIDNDSISYELVAPLVSRLNPAPYVGAFSPSRPITFLGYPSSSLNTPAGFRLNSSGNIFFRPTRVNEVAPIAVVAKEWRKINGIMTLVANNQNEICVRVVSSNKNKQVYQNTPDFFYGCKADTSIARIDVRDTDTGQNYTFSLQHNLKWAKIEQVGGAKSKVAFVYYLLDTTKSINSTNGFTVLVKDNGCNVAGKSIKSYAVYGLDSFKDTTEIIKKMLCGEVSFDINKVFTAPSVLPTYSMEVFGAGISTSSITGKVSVRPKDTGWVKCRLTVSASKRCNSHIYLDSIYVAAKDILTPFLNGGGFVCFSTPVTLSATNNVGFKDISLLWSTGDTTPLITVIPPKGKKYYYLTLRNNVGCLNTDSILITNNHPEVTLSGTKYICNTGDSVFLEAKIKDTSSPFYQWEGLTNSLTAKEFLKYSPTAYTKQYTFTLFDAGCVLKSDWRVHVIIPKIQFVHNMAVCINDTIELKGVGQNGVPPYKISWLVGSFDTGSSIKINTKGFLTGRTPFFATVTDSLGCKGESRGEFTIYQLPTIVFDASKANVCQFSDLNLNGLATPFGGTWQGAQVASNTPTAKPTDIGLYPVSYTYTDVNKCSSTGQSYVRVVSIPKPSFVADSVKITLGSEITFTNNTVADTIFSSQWFFGNGDKSFLSNPSYTYPDTGKYTVSLTVDNKICPPQTSTNIQYIEVVAPRSTSKHLMWAKPKRLELYPNPASDALRVEIGELAAAYTCTDVLGREWQLQSINNQISIAHLPIGIYWLKVVDKLGAVYAGKFEVVR